MSPAEYEGWSKHVSRYTTGDHLTHTLLARILALLANSLGRKQDSRPYHHFDFAPWLLRLGGREAREYLKMGEKVRFAKARAHASMVTSAYKLQKERADA